MLEGKKAFESTTSNVSDYLIPYSDVLLVHVRYQ